MEVGESIGPTLEPIDARWAVSNAAQSKLVEQEEHRRVIIAPHRLEGLLTVPAAVRGLVIFALASGGGDFSRHDKFIARRLEERGFATLLLELPSEQENTGRADAFNVDLLAERLIEAAEWAHAQTRLLDLPIGYFGTNAGTAAALAAAAMNPQLVCAIVSRSGRPDLAGAALGFVRAPTLLLVGGRDRQMLDFNRRAMEQMKCTIELISIPGAGNLFEEPSALDFAGRRAAQWLEQRLARPATATAGAVVLPFPSRAEAGRMVAQQLVKLGVSRPLVLALPRGGVPVAYEVAKGLDGELDLLLVRKLSVPRHVELVIGAIVDGNMPQIIVNREVLGRTGLPTSFICNEAHKELRELERQRDAYLAGRPPIPVEGRTVIIVDDGIATQGPVRAALRALRPKKPARLMVAVPVGAPESVRSLAGECDELMCLATPEPFCAVGAHYRDFTQISDEDVKRLVRQVRRTSAMVRSFRPGAARLKEGGRHAG